MIKPILHIPSVISQSCFTNTKGDVVDLKRYEIDYFYLLLFLYREELLKQTPNLLLRDGNRYYFNELIPYKSVKIELYEFHQYGVVDNYKYDELKIFIDNLSKLSINTNLLRKNKDKDIETIKVIDTHSWNSTLLTLNFTKEFVKELIGVEKFFMEVDLTFLFNLNGEKSKSLYLVLKDYSKIGNKNFTKDKLSLLIGKIPQKDRFEKIRDEINEVTDIKISYDVVGVKKKDYKFKINYKINLKTSSKSKTSKSKDEINTEVMEKSKKKLQQMKDKGVKIENEDGYLKTIYYGEMEKITPSYTQKRLDTWIEECKKEYLIDKTNSKIPFIGITNGNNEIFINDDYLLTNSLDYYSKNPTETIVEMNNKLQNGYEIGVIYLDRFPSSFSKVCYLTSNELRKRGLI